MFLSRFCQLLSTLTIVRSWCCSQYRKIADRICRKLDVVWEGGLPKTRRTCKCSERALLWSFWNEKDTSAGEVWHSVGLNCCASSNHSTPSESVYCPPVKIPSNARSISTCGPPWYSMTVVKRSFCLSNNLLSHWHYPIMYRYSAVNFQCDLSVT